MKHKATLHINSGICKCGHPWYDHHLGVICNDHVWKAIEAHIKTHFPGRIWKDEDYEMSYPMYVPGECEYFGCNEMGGMAPKQKDITKEELEELPWEGDLWEDHCHHYKDKDGPLGEVEWDDGRDVS